MEGRRLLDKIDYEKGTIRLEEKSTGCWTQISPPLTRKTPTGSPRRRKGWLERLQAAFLQCDKLQQHMLLLLNKGSLYKVFNNNLLYHGLRAHG